MVLELWQLIVGAIVTVVTSGALSYLIFYRSKKVGANADAASKAGDVMSDWFVLFQEQQRLLKTALTENETYRRNVIGLELRVSELERRLSGVQKALEREVALRKYSEEHICLLTDCRLRQPTLGTYKSNDQTA